MAQQTQQQQQNQQQQLFVAANLLSIQLVPSLPLSWRTRRMRNLRLPEITIAFGFWLSLLA